MLYSTNKEERFCLNCPYGKFLNNRFYCPFVEGSCVRLPETILKPAPSYFDHIMDLSGYQRIQTNEGRKL